MECLMIGRDLVRLLQNVARIPEFELLWKDIIHNPQALSPQFTGEQAPRCALSLYVLSGFEGVEVNWQERFSQRKLGVGQTLLSTAGYGSGRSSEQFM